MQDSRKKYLEFFKKIIKEDFSGSFLIYGERGIGKNDFCKQIISQIFQTENYKNHPDYYEIKKAKDKKIILIQDIREVLLKLNLASHQGGYKIIYVRDADKMLPESANVLLKNIEEPGKKTIFLLSTNKIKSILPTIKSRCVKIYLGPLSKKTILKKLSEKINNENLIKKLAAFSLGKINRINKIKNESDFEMQEKFVKNVFKYFFNADLVSCFLFSSEFNKKGIKFRNALNTILIILRDLLLMKNNNYKNISFIFLEKDYQKILEKFPEQKILELSKQILDYKRIIKYNISEKLILENICFENYKNE